MQHRPAEKAPAIDGRDKLSRAGRNVEFSPSALQHLWGDCRAEHPLVAGPTSWVLFISAKKCSLKPPLARKRLRCTKTFEIDQNFESGARNRRPTVVGQLRRCPGSSI